MDVEDGSATPRSPVSVELRFRSHTLVQDKPVASGGRDEGPMASELLLGALLACQHSTFVKVAAKRRTAIELLALRGEVHFKDGDVERITVHFDVSASLNVTDDAVDTLIRLTDRACTITKALRVPVESTYVRRAMSSSR